MTASPSTTTSQDLEHLRMLSVFHYILGGLHALCYCFPIIHLIAGIVMIVSPGAFDGGKPGQGPPPFVGWFFVLFAAAIMVVGWTLATCVILAGRFLAHHRNYLFCLVVAAIMCVIMMPLGTVLGVFTIIVLMRPSVKVLFGRATPLEVQTPS